MEEEMAAAYYDELSRKGEGAARFKQGLGFSSSSCADVLPSKSSSSLFSNFVRASSPDCAEKHAQLAAIQRKLGKGDDHRGRRRSPSPDRGRGRRERDDGRRSSSRERDRRRRDRESRSPARRRREEEDEEKAKDRRRRRRRSRSTSRDGECRGRRRRDRSRSPSRDKHGRDRNGDYRRGKSSPRGHESSKKDENAGVDYSKLIEGYSQMTPAERVKAKMKLQLSQTAAKDTAMGMKSGWERFDFNKEAPLDDDDEIEVAEDDASLVKDIGQSFRFSAVEAKREEAMKAAHDQAMFGVPVASSLVVENRDSEGNVAREDEENIHNNVLISDKVLAMQRGSWRERARKFHCGSRN